MKNQLIACLITIPIVVEKIDAILHKVAIAVAWMSTLFYTFFTVLLLFLAITANAPFFPVLILGIASCVLWNMLLDLKQA